MKNIFTQEITNEVIERINSLSEKSQPEWGTMSVDQMFAHCSVTYEMIYDNIHPRPNAIIRFILKKLVKNKVVSDKPYPKNGKTAPQFIIKGTKDFGKEKERLIAYIERTQKLGESHFDGLESLSFGNLTVDEWNNTFYKHLDHHLTQFGV